MNAQEFCYWLQGFCELKPDGDVAPPTEAQWAMIRQHLQYVFDHPAPMRQPALMPPLFPEPYRADVLRGGPDLLPTTVC